MEALADDEFRLLILLPGDRHEPLRCELRTSTLTHHLAYEALSYTWGSSTDDVEIEVAGKRRTITKNLETILLRLRFTSEPRVLWIDQLCINQSNSGEKTTQVQKMRSIYSSCTRVLIWMGEFADNIRREDAEGAFAVLKYMAAVDSANKARIPLPQPPKCMASNESFRAAMSALGTISVRNYSWWHRVWTVQEAILPDNGTLVWGPLTLSWDTIVPATSGWLSHGYSCMTREQIQISIELGGMGHLMARFYWIRIPKEGPDGPIATSLRWRDRVATDQRDNVYALTGLHTAVTMPRSSKCDYSLSLNQVLINFTLDLIDGSGNVECGDLCPLILDPWRKEIEDTPGLPHWTIDMRSGPTYNTGLWRSFWFYDYYEANKGLPVNPRPECTGEVLRVPGIAIDTVETVGDGFVCPGDEPDLFPKPRETIISWWNMYCKTNKGHLQADFSGVSPTNCREYEDFCRLVLGGLIQGRGGHGAPPERRAIIRDRQNVSHYLHTGEENYTLRPIVGQLRNRRFFITKEGLIGLGHLETMPGDEVWVLNHGRMPFTLRARGTPPRPSHENGEDYDFVGHCYVQGIMEGLEIDGERGLANLEQRIVCLY